MVWVLVGFAALFLAIALLISRKAPAGDVDDFVVAGRRLPFGLISASVLVSWLWTTSLLGAAEAGYLFGIGGGFAFALGSAVPFFVFIPLALRLRRMMPEGTTFLEFVKQRYGTVTHHIFIAFTVLVALYIAVEQIIGIAYAVSGSYDVPYAVVAVSATAVVVGYIAIAGLRGAVVNDVIQFLVISLVALILLPLVLIDFGVADLHAGLVEAATNEAAPVHVSGAASFWAAAAARYFAVALVVSFGFVLLNQGYYSKARAAASNRSLLWAYIVGTVVAWLPIPILFGVILGGIGIADGLRVGEELAVSTDVSSHVIVDTFGSVGVLLFVLVIFMAGLTTASNTLAGFQANIAVDFEGDLVSRERTSAQKKQRTQWLTVAFGVIVAGFALALEGQSLLKIDIFSGIIFSTPMAALIFGLTSRRPNATLAIVSVVVGLAGGLATYAVIDNPNLDYFYGNVVALVIPALVIVGGSAFSPARYDFSALQGYRSKHRSQAAGTPHEVEEA